LEAGTLFVSHSLQNTVGVLHRKALNEGKKICAEVDDLLLL
jgi:hypothetical protein